MKHFIVLLLVATTLSIDCDDVDPECSSEDIPSEFSDNYEYEDDDEDNEGNDRICTDKDSFDSNYYFYTVTNGDGSEKIGCCCPQASYSINISEGDSQFADNRRRQQLI